MKNFIKIFPHILIWAIVLIVPTYLMSREGVFDSKPFTLSECVDFPDFKKKNDEL